MNPLDKFKKSSCVNKNEKPKMLVNKIMLLKTIVPYNENGVIFLKSMINLSK